MSITRIGYQVGSSTFNLDGSWTYDNEGRPLTMTYPVVTDPSMGIPTSTAFTYTYDSMGRPATMGPGGPQGYIVNGVQYNAADQMTQISYYSADGTGLSIGETRGYNSMFQLTSISAGWTSNSFPQSFSETYIYSGTQNNGQITSVVEGTGESVSYQYDKLKRLISANSTAGWSQSYTYDGFGNMTSRSPGFNIYADVTTNRMMGFTYDANGNLHNGNWNYDVENRVVSVDASGGEQYMYDPSNKRIYKQNSGAPTYFYYGLDGKVVGEYTVNWSSSTLGLNRVTESAYFGGKKVLPTVARDRLGSVRGNASAANKPYGENYTGANADGFATYYQDASTQLNYADQRYYAASYGRFNTPDRYVASGGLNDPGSWNRYAYVGNDPANYLDSRGMQRQSAGDGDPPCGDSDSGCDGDFGTGVVRTFADNEDSNVDITVQNFSQSGPNQVTIANVLGDIVQGLNSGNYTDCNSWLQGSTSMSPSAFIGAILEANNFGHGSFNTNGTAAFAGSRNEDGTPTGVSTSAAFTVNDGGAFFNAKWDDRTLTVGPRAYKGGTLKAQAFILIHELGHILSGAGGAKGFQPDAHNKKAGKENDKLVEKNCGKLIGGLK